MAKKKVLVDVFYLHVAQTGIKTYMECLCGEIAASDSQEFEFIVSPDPKRIIGSSFFKGKTTRWKNLLYQALYFYRKLVVIPWLSIRHRADLVFSPDILSPVWARGIKVSVIHDAFFWESPEHYNSLWLKVYLRVLNMGLKNNARVITISKYSKKQLQKHLNLPHLPIHIVYPSSNIRPKEKTKLSQPLINFPYFLHVGVMEKRKNLTMLVEAFSGFVKQEGFANYKLVLVGQRGPRKTLDDYDNIRLLVEKHQLSDKVVLPGYVKTSELENYYHHAVGYVFPSLNEGFGMPILEAFSYGLPVIIANQTALQEVGGEAVLMVGENTPEGFEEALIKVAANKSVGEHMTERGFLRLQKFSSANFFLSLKDCFRMILNEQNH